MNTDKDEFQISDLRLICVLLCSSVFICGFNNLWLDRSDDSVSAKNFQRAFNDLIKNYPRDNRFVEKALTQVAPFHAPYLWNEAEKLMEGWKNEDWNTACDLVKQLRDRYPETEAAKRALAETEWLFAWKAGTDVLKKEKETGVARTPSLLRGPLAIGRSRSRCCSASRTSGPSRFTSGPRTCAVTCSSCVRGMDLSHAPSASTRASRPNDSSSSIGTCCTSTTTSCSNGDGKGCRASDICCSAGGESVRRKRSRQATSLDIGG